MIGSDDSEKKAELLKRVRERHALDARWELQNFLAYHIFRWSSIFTSLVAATVAAFNLADSHVIAFLAIIPGVIIFIDRQFLFARRWRWHNAMATQYKAYEHQLLFEHAAVENVSEAMSKFKIRMEKIYPAVTHADGVIPSLSKHDP